MTIISIPIKLLADGFNELFTFAGGFQEHLIGIAKLSSGIALTWGVINAIKGALLIKEQVALGYSIKDATIGKGKLATLAAQAVAWTIMNPFIALAGLAIAGGVGAAIYSSMKDGVIDPSKGPIMSGGFGSVQLDPKDKAMYGADGTIKVGTNLGGGKSNSTPQQQDNSALIAEMRAMRQEQAKSNSKPTVIENSVNGTRFGTAVDMNTYKTS